MPPVANDMPRRAVSESHQAGDAGSRCGTRGEAPGRRDAMARRWWTWRRRPSHGWHAVSGIPFYCWKAVTDIATEDLPDFNYFLDQEKQLRTRQVAAYALTHPRYVAPLLRMGKNSKSGAEALGQRSADGSTKEDMQTATVEKELDPSAPYSGDNAGGCLPRRERRTGGDGAGAPHWPWRSASAGGHVRRLRHRSQEDPHRLALGPAHLRP